MAESTPGNLGPGFFGGWAAGRATGGNRSLDRSVDRLEEQVNKFSDALSRATSVMSSAAGGAGGGQTSQSSAPRGNGGGATFGGAPATGEAGPAHRAPGGMAAGWSGMGVGGAHRAGPAHAGGRPTGGFGSSQWGFGGNGVGGAHAAGSQSVLGGVGNYLGQNAGSIARYGAAGMVGGAAVYTANHYSNQVMGSTLASMYSGGGPWNSAYQGGMRGNYTAHSTQDFFQTVSQMGQQGYQRMGSSGWNRQMSAVQSYSATNPMISNAQGSQASTSLAAPGSFNKMRGMGINPLGAGGMGDPRSVARQMISRMNTQGVKSPEQVAAMFGPAGAATVTINSFVSSGMLPPDSAPVVLSEMRNILNARVNGMNYSDYNRNANTASRQGDAGNSARNALGKVGIGANTLVQRQHRSEGLARESEAETIGGFVKAVDAATDVTDKFREALNKILKIPGVGEVTGAATGVLGKVPVVGGILNKFTSGITGLSMDGPASMSSAAMSYGGAAMAMGAAGDGTSAMGSSAMSYGGASAMMAGGASSGKASTGSAGGGGKKYPLGAVKPWVQKAGDHIGNKFGIAVIGGYRASSAVSNSDHPKGLAIDVMCSTAKGNAMAPYIVANAGRLNVTYVIWRQRIWSINNRRWTGMEDRGSPTANHMDHVHVSFLASPNNPDLGGLPAGGGMGSGMPSGGGGGGGGGGSLGGTSGGDNGAMAGFASGGGGGGAGIGGYSEVAALALGSGGMGGGGAAGMPGMSAAGGGSAGGGGYAGGAGAQGGPGRARVGSLNILFTNSNRAVGQDLAIARSKTDVLGLSEARQRPGFLHKNMSEHGWGYYSKAGMGDTGIAWNSDKYSAIQKNTLDIADSVKYDGRNIKRGTTYVLLQDKESGTKFWVMSNHTQAHTSKSARMDQIQKTQHRQIGELYSRLRKTGLPVFNVGDFNDGNPRAEGAAPGAQQYGRGIDKILYGGAKGLGSWRMEGKGFGGGGRGGPMNTDHPFIWANFAIPGGSSSGGSAGGNGGTPSQNQALGKAMAAQRGWSGSQWAALKTLWQHESGWRTNADNPTSSAYGIPQALTETHGLGQKYKTDPKTQIQWGLNYIKQRYGSPQGAWNFWQRNNWYDSGEWNIRDDKDARVHKGEMIIPSKISDIIRDELAAPGIRDALGRSKGGGGVNVTFEPGSITITMPGNPSKREATRAAEWVVDAMMEDRRMRDLAER